MIVPMKKVSLIIMGDKKTDTLKKLRKLGILHVEIAEGSGEKLAELKERVSMLEKAIYTVSEKKVKNAQTDDRSVADAISAAEEIVALSEEKKECLAKKNAFDSELERIRSWGEIDLEKLEDLKAKGIEISLYEMPRDKYETLGEDVDHTEQNRNNVGKTRKNGFYNASLIVREYKAHYEADCDK